MSVNFEAVPAFTWAAPTDGRIGALGPVAALLAATTDPLPALQAPRLVAFGSDHGIAAAQVSAHPTELTRTRLTQLAAGAGLIGHAAALADVAVTTVDLTTPSGEWTASGRIDQEDALTDGDLERAITAGQDAANAAIDAGADLLIGTVVSVAVSTPAAVLTAAITGLEPVDATTRGSGIDDAAWIRKVAVVRDALRRCTLAGTDAINLLRVGGGVDLAALTGFIAQAAVRRTPVLVDDVPSALCAVLAQRLAPGTDAYVVVAARSDERPLARLFDVLGREPLTAWQLRVGGGLGALMLIPTLRLALATEAAQAEAREPWAVDAWDSHLL